MKRKCPVDDKSPRKKKKRKIELFETVKGDLLNNKQDYLIHQTNCVATKSHGLSEQVFKKYPEANLYEERRKVQKKTDNKFFGRGLPGTIQVYECGVINLLAQYYTGKAKYPSDGYKERAEWFEKCFDKLAIHFKDKEVSIAFPYRIGCGLAGGNWENYLEIIEEFLSNNKNVKMVMYKLD